jgi:hypothetical protein
MREATGVAAKFRAPQIRPVGCSSPRASMQFRAPDRFRVLSVAKKLFDISTGRLLTRAGIEQDVARLMIHTLPGGSPDGAADVFDRLLARADHLLGQSAIANLVLDEVEHQGALQ